MSNEDVDCSIERGGVPRVVIARVECARDAAETADRLGTLHPEKRFVCVVSSDLEDHLGPALTALHPVVSELIFFDAVTPPHRPGDDTAMQAMDALGLGQDFVFTVAGLHDAIDYALARTSPGDSAHWEATGVLVVGPPLVVDVAQRHGAAGTR